jgi:hypothetical protein
MDLMVEIEDTAARFRAGEAEVARAFFSRPRPLEQHVRWLKEQVSRELRNLREISAGELVDQVNRVDRGFSREDIVAELREHYLETRHYAMLADVLEGISGQPVDWKELDAQKRTADWSVSNHQNAQEQKRRQQWSSISPLHGAAGSFNSGGAGSVAFGMVGLEGGMYEELLAETGKMVIHDEMAHGFVLGRRHSLYTLVETIDDARTAVEVIREYSTIRLKGRNFQFGYPLSEERVEAIVRGEIEPLTLDTLQGVYADAIEEEEWFDRYRAAPKPLSAATILR